MNSGSIIIRNSVEQTNDVIKSETVSYCNITGAQRTVSQTFVQPSGKSPTKFRKMIHDISYSLPTIAIKTENTPNDENKDYKVILLNGSWDISNKIPNIVAEMHNIKSEDLQSLQNNTSSKQDVLFDCRDYLNPSPRGSDSGIESDCTDGNLSWLLNYKIHELPPVPDEKLENQQVPYNNACINNQNLVYNRNNDLQNINFSTNNKINNYTNNTSNIIPPPPDNQSQIINLADGCEESRGNNQSYRYSGPKKPPFTYTELIEHALHEKGELTVSGIYQWISEHFPFYKQNDDRWKNSVRHNLSINPHFRKGNKAVHGAGHLWTIAQKDDKKSWQIKQRMQQFIQTTKNQEIEDFDIELQAATASILGESFNNMDSDENIITLHDGSGKGKDQNIEIEYVNVIDVTNGLEDFLHPPVSKQQLVQECGLGNDFLITDLNPNTLGVNLSEAEVVASGDQLYDDISFEYYEMPRE